MGGWGYGSRGGVAVDDHIPGHALGHGCVEWFVHAHGFGLSAGERAFDTAGNAGDAEVIAEDGDACLADALDERLEVIELLIFQGAIEEDIVPEGGIEILDGFEFKVMGFDGLSEAGEFIERP